MLAAVVICAGAVSLAVLSLFMAAGDADRAIEDAREGGEMARFAEPYVEVSCEVRVSRRLAFTRAEWEEMDDRERDAAVRDAAIVGASVTWRYAPSGREGAAK